MRNFTRRTAINLALSAAFVTQAHAQDSGESEEDFDELLRSELNRATDRAITTKEAAALIALYKDSWATSVKSRPDAVWAPLERNADYAHLAGYPAPSGSFSITAATLQWLADRNSFILDAREPITMFGLRGCGLEGTADLTEWAQTHVLNLLTPNHVEMRCVIGAWNRATGDIRLFKGSTVPEATLVWASRNLGGNGGKDECNMQATGLYEYVAGSHAVTGKFPQHGVLRQPNDQNILVLRSPNNVSFDPTEATEVYDQGFFANNFHSACRKSGKPFFSAGCQIVAGSYEKENDATGFQPGTRPTGAWREFRIAIGLEEQPTAFRSDHPDKSRRFQYILLTGLEAALFASADPKFLEKYQSLRFGSRSAADGNVAQLQRELGIPPTGRFDAITAYEQVRKMNRSGSFETPILAL